MPTVIEYPTRSTTMTSRHKKEGLENEPGGRCPPDPLGFIASGHTGRWPQPLSRARISKEVRRETNEACHEHLSHPEKVAGEPGGSPQTCRISTWCAARVASPQSPILRPSKSQATNDFSMCKKNGNINPKSGSICHNLNWPLRGPEKESTSIFCGNREIDLSRWNFYVCN